jgi:hypothetical protein
VTGGNRTDGAVGRRQAVDRDGTWRNPSRKWRVLAVAVVLAIPGALVGELASLLVALPGGVVGCLAGALIGAVLEANG